jgi:hypothetical protein
VEAQHQGSLSIAPLAMVLAKQAERPEFFKIVALHIPDSVGMDQHLEHS